MKTISERHDKKDMESPLFLGKGFWRPQTAIQGRSIRGPGRIVHEKELEKHEEVKDTEEEDW